MSPVDRLAELFASDGAADYLGEPVTVAQHLLQAGALAERAGGPAALVAAALLHDTGLLRGADPLADFRQQAEQAGLPVNIRYLARGETYRLALGVPGS